MPDRVIPDDLKDVYENGSHDPVEMAALIHELIERVASLEAEKQAAYTEGWNAAIEAAAEHCMQLGLLPSTKDGSQTLRNVAFGITLVLSKPTAAKPEPSPSSAKRAEGRP